MLNYTLIEFYIKKICSLISETCGFDTEKKQEKIFEEILDYISMSKFFNVVHYYNYLISPEGENEIERLISKILPSDTLFFRNREQFRILGDYILPDIIKRKNGHQISILSAGCSTGEETYSISIVVNHILNKFLSEYKKSILSDWEVEILGTDINVESLRFAEKGIYSKSSLVELSEHKIKDYFLENNNKYLVKFDIKQNVKFSYHNILRDSFGDKKFDIIFCRKILSYATQKHSRQIVDNLYEALNDGGYLFIDSNENIIGTSFVPVDIGDVTVYRKTEKLLSKVLLNRITNIKIDKVANDSKIKKNDDNKKDPPSLKNLPESDINDKSLLDLFDVNLLEDELEFNQDNEAERKKSQAYLNELVNIADKQTSCGEYDEAMETCKRILEINPEFAPVYYIMGELCYLQGDVQKSIENLKRAIHFDNNFIMAHFKLANIYQSILELNSAISEYKITMKLLENLHGKEEINFSHSFIPAMISFACEKNLKLCMDKISNK